MRSYFFEGMLLLPGFYTPAEVTVLQAEAAALQLMAHQLPAVVVKRSDGGGLPLRIENFVPVSPYFESLIPRLAALVGQLFPDEQPAHLYKEKINYKVEQKATKQQDKRKQSGVASIARDSHFLTDTFSILFLSGPAQRDTHRTSLFCVSLASSSPPFPLCLWALRQLVGRPSLIRCFFVSLSFFLSCSFLSFFLSFFAATVRRWPRPASRPISSP